MRYNLCAVLFVFFAQASDSKGHHVLHPNYQITAFQQCSVVSSNSELQSTCKQQRLLGRTPAWSNNTGPHGLKNNLCNFNFSFYKFHYEVYILSFLYLLWHEHLVFKWLSFILQVIYKVHSTSTISLFSDLHGLQVLLFMPSKFSFNRWLLGVQNCSNRSSGQRSSNRTLELELGNLFLKHKSFSTTFISFTVVNVLNTQLQSTISRFLNYNYFKCIRIHMLWYVLLKLYRIFTSFLVESTTNSIAFVCYDVWTLSLLQTFINPKLLLQYAWPCKHLTHYQK